MSADEKKTRIIPKQTQNVTNMKTTPRPSRAPLSLKKKTASTRGSRKRILKTLSTLRAATSIRSGRRARARRASTPVVAQPREQEHVVTGADEMEVEEKEMTSPTPVDMAPENPPQALMGSIP